VKKHLQGKTATGPSYYNPTSKVEVKEITKSMQQALDDGFHKGHLTSKNTKL